MFISIALTYRLSQRCTLNINVNCSLHCFFYFYTWATFNHGLWIFGQNSALLGILKQPDNYSFSLSPIAYAYGRNVVRMAYLDEYIYIYLWTKCLATCKHPTHNHLIIHPYAVMHLWTPNLYVSSSNLYRASICLP